MLDTTIPMLPLVMRAELDGFIRIPELPEGFSLRRFCPGDEINWCRIQVASGAIDDMEKAMEAFDFWFPEKNELPERMLFMTNGSFPVATAAAWFGDGTEKSIGRLHWVALDAKYQGRGLCLPLVASTVNRMRELGHRSAYLTTQTSSWIAIKTYSRIGFKPSFNVDINDREGWKIVSEKTGIDFLK